jgi:inorganic phosphate transporter, PiT family
MRWSSSFPPKWLSPPNGGPAVGMLVALFVAALFWNIGTWWLALPNSSSHCLIGSLIGVAVGNAFVRSRSLSDGVHWPQLWKVLEALAVSPILGFALAGLLYFICRRTLHDENLYKPVGDKPPIWWMRGILILTCSGVSFSHGTNDGQKSIGLITLTIIGLFPATYALNPNASQSLDHLPAQATSPPAPHAQTKQQKSGVRDDVYRVISQLRHAEDSKSISAPEKKEAQRLSKQLGSYVEYAPFWVRMLSALYLGIGTMIGYKRIVKTLGERLGNVHLTPAQGASAELVSAVLIGTAGFTGLPVSTTHIVTSGIGGTMVASGAGLRYAMIRRIVLAWVLTLPATILVAGGLYYVLASPKF